MPMLYVQLVLMLVFLFVASEDKAKFAKSFGITVGVMYLLVLCTRPRDATDPQGLFQGRSGMVLRTDAGTGCQYLQSATLLGETGIIPRVNGAGEHMGCRR